MTEVNLHIKLGLLPATDAETRSIESNDYNFILKIMLEIRIDVSV